MAATMGFSAYIDVPAYLRAATNLETASLLGLNTTVGGSGAAPAGTTTLPVAASAGWAAGLLWLLDGPYSEMVMVAAAPDGAHLTLAAPGTVWPHAPGVSASQTGTAGALAEIILAASGWIENYCQQGASATDRSLYAVSRAERWGLPSSRAAFDRDGVLALRPGHFPVQSVSALGVECAPGQSLSLDVTQIEIASSGRLIEAPSLAVSAGLPVQPSLWEYGGVSRSARQWVAVTYIGGLPVGAVPYDLRQACVWLVSDLLGQRRNPSGAAMVRMGRFELQARPRGDTTGESILMTQAKAALEAYRERL
ncbi:MAG TPA: hypothetical protein VJN88_02150 [Ktedonobacterales bacterium]|nr:hypothetical protein [Ktedonobacterales bacterium]